MQVWPGRANRFFTYWTVTFETGEISAAIWIFNEQNAHNLNYITFSYVFELRNNFFNYMNEEIRILVKNDRIMVKR